MHTSNTPSHSSWPFPATGHFRRAPAATNADPIPAPDEDAPDPVEQELVNEQLERDRKASRAVDSKIRDRATPSSK